MIQNMVVSFISLSSIYYARLLKSRRKTRIVKTTL